MRRTLQNGVRTQVVDVPSARSCAVRLAVWGGVRHDPVGKAGLSHALEHMLFNGTDRLDRTGLYQYAESRCIELNAATHRHSIVLQATCPPDAVVDATKLLVAMAERPAFDQAALTKELGVIAAEVREELDGNGRSVCPDTVSKQALWVGKMGRPIAGTLANVSSYTLRDITALHRKLFVGSNMVGVVVGPVSSPDQLYQCLSSLPKGIAPKKPSPPKLADRRRARVRNHQWAQLDVTLTYPCPPSNTGKQHAAMLALSEILTGGFSSALRAELVEKRGWVYSPHSHVDDYGDVATLVISWSCLPKRAVAARTLVQDTLSHIATHGPTQEQLDHAVAQLQFSYQCLWDSPSDLADHLVYHELSCTPVDPWELLNTVTVTDVANVAKGLVKPLVTIIG